jgi:excisionase family DNA binding protein
VPRLISKERERTEYLMNPAEVRQLLGLGRTYTYQLLATGVIPSIRIGRLRKVRRSDLDAFIEAHLEHNEGGDDE